MKTMNESVSVMTALNIACAPVTPSASPFQANRVSIVSPVALHRQECDMAIRKGILTFA